MQNSGRKKGQTSFGDVLDASKEGKWLGILAALGDGATYSKLLKVSEVCAVLRCKKSKVYQLVKDGLLEVVRIPGIRVEETVLLAFIDQRRSGASRQRRKYNSASNRH